MALTTTPGAANADAYVSLAAFKTWAAARGLDLAAYADADLEAAIRRATVYLDRAYAGEFDGYPVNGRAQALAFPMVGLVDCFGYGVPSETIPREVEEATCEGAAREVAKPGALMPDVKAGGGIIQRVKSGDVEVEYASGGEAYPKFPAIDAALTFLRRSAALASDPYSVASVRG